MTKTHLTLKTCIIFLVCLCVFVFFKNAWVCDDSYINFRSIEQLYEGNGPIWNPHERVQVYTSVLWYWLMAGIRYFSSDYFSNVICVSFVLFAILLFSVLNHFKFSVASAFFLLALLGSNSFFDYTTSGLENILGYILVLPVCFYAFNKNQKFRPFLFGAFALAPLFRHDFITLLAIPALTIVFTDKNLKLKHKFFQIILLLTPLALWTAFSFIYYGTPVPNTAIAKLSTGIPQTDLLLSGLKYYAGTFRRDPLSAILLISGIIVALKSGNIFLKSIGAGIITNLLYIIYVGGDFMSGRFISYAVLISALIIANSDLPNRCLTLLKNKRTFAITIYFIYLLMFYHTPLNTWSGLEDYSDIYGISDERAYYFSATSLFAYAALPSDKLFPDFEWAHIGHKMRNSDEKIWTQNLIGFCGYWAGTKPIIIDTFALSDPFLARNPVSKSIPWRIGHFTRDVPIEYYQSLNIGENLFNDPKQAELYDLVVKATQDKDLFSTERLKALLKLNFNL